MRIYEIKGLDVGQLMENFIKEGLNKHQSSLKENANDDLEYVATFIDAANSNNIDQNNLIKGNSYFPISIAIQIYEKHVKLMLTPMPIEFDSIVGSRLRFVTSKNVPIFFPSDDSLINNAYRIVVDKKDLVDQIVNIAVLKFKVDNWILSAIALNDDGGYNQVLNI